MTKKNEVYAYSIILNSNKKQQTTDKSYNMQEPQKHYAKCKKPDLIDGTYLKWPGQAHVQRRNVFWCCGLESDFTANGQKDSFRGYRNVLKMDCGQGCPAL